MRVEVLSYGGSIKSPMNAAYLLKRQLFEACSIHIYVLHCLLEAGELDKNDSLTGSCFFISRTHFQNCNRRQFNGTAVAPDCMQDQAEEEVPEVCGTHCHRCSSGPSYTVPL